MHKKRGKEGGCSHMPGAAAPNGGCLRPTLWRFCDDSPRTTLPLSLCSVLKVSVFQLGAYKWKICCPLQCVLDLVFNVTAGCRDDRIWIFTHMYIALISYFSIFCYTSSLQKSPRWILEVAFKVPKKTATSTLVTFSRAAFFLFLFLWFIEQRT